MSGDETWQRALRAWLEAGRPGGGSVVDYLRWTHEHFGLDPARPLHLQERWELDAASWEDPSAAGAQRGAPMREELERSLERASAERGFPLEPVGTYSNADGRVRAKLLRVSAPGGALLNPRVRLLEPELQELNLLLEASNALRLPSLVEHVLDGKVYQHVPLPAGEGGAGISWVLDPAPHERPTTFKLWRVGSERVETGERRTLLLALELQLRANLRPWDGKEAATPERGTWWPPFKKKRRRPSADEAPPWVGRGRELHVKLLAELRNERLEREAD